MRRSTDRSILRVTTIAVAIAAIAACSGAPEPTSDRIARGSLVVDGQGGPAVGADVAAVGGRIAAIGALGDATARRSLDASGIWIAPGFIDLHSHADPILLADAATQQRLMPAKIRQGVTTVVVGNCGLGPARSDDRSAPILAAINAWMTPAGVAPGPSSIEAYLDRLEASGVAIGDTLVVEEGRHVGRFAGRVLRAGVENQK